MATRKTKFLLEGYIERGKKIETMERLLKEARSLMIEVGESMDVPIQFRQHGWLTEVNELIPPTE